MRMAARRATQVVAEPTNNEHGEANATLGSNPEGRVQFRRFALLPVVACAKNNGEARCPIRAGAVARGRGETCYVFVYTCDARHSGSTHNVLIGSPTWARTRDLQINRAALVVALLPVISDA